MFSALTFKLSILLIRNDRITCMLASHFLLLLLFLLSFFEQLETIKSLITLRIVITYDISLGLGLTSHVNDFALVVHCEGINVLTIGLVLMIDTLVVFCVLSILRVVSHFLNSALNQFSLTMFVKGIILHALSLDIQFYLFRRWRLRRRPLKFA